MPTRETPLFLHEEILLLALRDEKGTAVQNYSYPMGGAILAELLLTKRIEVADERRKLVELTSSKKFGEPVLDECLDKLKAAKRRASLRTWVTRFAQTKNLKHRVAEGLCKRGILRADEDKVLWIFTRKIYPERDPKPERKIIERLRKAIFTNTREVDPRTVVLLSLARSADLLKIPFDKKKLKERKQRIEKITSGDLVGKAAREAIQAMQAAVMIATIVPAVTVAATAGR
jgi:hypothetical protein